MILSLDYEIAGEYLGKSIEELEAIGKQIESENPFQFDEEEVKRLVLLARAALSVSTRKLVLDGLRWFFPLGIVLALLLAIWLN
jgi:hypothetical protein